MVNLIREILFEPFRQLLPGWITKNFNCSGFASPMLNIVLNGCLSLFITIPTGTAVRLMQTSGFFILFIPKFYGM